MDSKENRQNPARHKGKILKSRSTAKANQPPGQWLLSHWLERFLFVYGAWMLLYFLAPVFMYLGWNRTGEAILFLAFIFMWPIHGTLILSLWSKEDVLLE